MKEPLDSRDPLASIEDRLRRMVPAELPSELAERLNSPPPRSGTVIYHTWRLIALAAAASVAIAAVWVAKHRDTEEDRQLSSLSAITPESIRIYAPISSRNLLLDAREVGVVEPQNSPPVRLVRCLWVDDSTYRPDNGGEDLQVTRTREQIIPVAFEIY